MGSLGLVRFVRSLLCRCHGTGYRKTAMKSQKGTVYRGYDFIHRTGRNLGSGHCAATSTPIPQMLGHSSGNTQINLTHP